MKNIDENIMLYISGNMTEKSLIEFRALLDNSPDIYARYMEIMDSLGAIKAKVNGMPLNDTYFSNLEVNLKNSIEIKNNTHKNRNWLYRGFSYTVALGLIAVITFLFYQNMPDTNYPINETVNQMSDTVKAQMLSQISDNDDLYRLADEELKSDKEFQAVVEDKINEKIEEEMSVPESDVQKISSSIETYEIINDISDTEADEICKSILDTKIL